MRKANRLPLTRPNVPVRNGRAASRLSDTGEKTPKFVSLKRVMVFGTFDLLHPGHEFFLREAACRGSLTVVVARDENVRRIKGRMPLQTQEQRIEAIRKRFPTATVIPGDRRGFLMPLRKLVPDLILLGYDQALPPGITEDALVCITERIRAFRPRQFKSSFSRLPGKRGVAGKKKT